LLMALSASLRTEVFILKRNWRFSGRYGRLEVSVFCMLASSAI
jgi:hypothetical protein